MPNLLKISRSDGGKKFLFFQIIHVFPILLNSVNKFVMEHHLGRSANALLSENYA